MRHLLRHRRRRQDDDRGGARARRRAPRAATRASSPSTRPSASPTRSGSRRSSDTPSEIDRDRWDGDGAATPGGRLSALMLDTKSTFDQLVTRQRGDRRAGASASSTTASTATSPARSAARRSTWRWRSCTSCTTTATSTSSSSTRRRPGTRSTSSTRRAGSLRLLDNRIFRLLMMPTRAYLRVASVAVQAFLRTVARVVGTEVIDDVVAFFRAFEGMEAGFRDRARRGRAAARRRRRPRSCSSPRRGATRWRRRQFFADRLDERRPEGRGADRQPRAPDVRRRVARRAARRGAPSSRDRRRPADAAERLAARYENLADFREIAELERGHLAGLRRRGSAPAAIALRARTSPATSTTSPRSARSAGPLRGSPTATT